MSIRFAKAERPRRVPLSPEEQVLARTLYDAIQRASDKISIKELEALVRNLDPILLDRLLRTITIANQTKIRETLIASIDVGGQEAIRQIRKIAPRLAPPSIPMPRSKKPKVTFNLLFDKTNPNALAIAERRAGELVTSIDDLTRTAVREAIIRAFKEKVDYRETARRIKNSVGLHPRWAEAVENFEKKEFARLMRSGLKEETARARARVRADRYSESLKSKRATMIARTEIQIAQNEGRFEGWRQASEEGFVDAQSQKMWMTAPDERVCDICSELDGETVQWQDNFSNGAPSPIAHPNCRCAMVIIPPDRSR